MTARTRCSCSDAVHSDLLVVNNEVSLSQGWAFMKRLACYLVERGLSKVRYDHRSLLFSKQTAADEFFGSDDAGPSPLKPRTTNPQLFEKVKLAWKCVSLGTGCKPLVGSVRPEGLRASWQ